MGVKMKKGLFIVIVISALGLLITASVTFAYFLATVKSEENAIRTTSAEFKLTLTEDLSLIKNQMIPSAERYVDITRIRRDQDGNLKSPYEDPNTHELITLNTACIDDSGYEICSIYTFTLVNDSTNNIPIDITLIPNNNTFKNLYFKVMDDDDNIIMTKEKVGTTPITLELLDTLEASLDLSNPNKKTYSIIMWIDETNADQTEDDGNKIFKGTINVKSRTSNSEGITGYFSVSGTE